jgi:ferric-dicitrate binding protein FerR (iron transport regulator)
MADIVKRSVKEMNKLNDILKNWEPPFSRTTDEAWKNLEPRLSQAKKGKVLRFSWKPMISVAAAAAVIVMIVMVWPKNRLILRQTATAQTEVITLPDGSVMTLNAESSASYSDDWSKERSLILNGQAFFEVRKGSKFSVVTEQGVIEVLGTSFDVFSRSEKFRVLCYTGKVRVTSGENTIDLTPGSIAERKGKTLAFGTFNLADANWLTGEFVYQEEPLANVMAEIGRQFNVEIISPDLSGRLYSGRFNNKDLHQALELVCLPMGLKFEIQEGNKVVISQMAK